LPQGLEQYHNFLILVANDVAKYLAMWQKLFGNVAKVIWQCGKSLPLEFFPSLTSSPP